MAEKVQSVVWPTPSSYVLSYLYRTQSIMQKQKRSQFLSSSGYESGNRNMERSIKLEKIGRILEDDAY